MVRRRYMHVVYPAVLLLFHYVQLIFSNEVYACHRLHKKNKSTSIIPITTSLCDDITQLHSTGVKTIPISTRIVNKMKRKANE